MSSGPAIGSPGGGNGSLCRTFDIALGILIAAVPLTYSVLAPGSLKWVILGALVPIIGFLWLWGGCGRPFRPLPRLLVPLLCLFLVMAVSLFHAINVQYGLQRMAFVLFLILLYLIVAYTAHPDRQDVLIRYLLLTLLVVSGFSLSGCLLGQTPVNMIFRLFGNTNYGASYLVTIIPLSLALLLGAPRRFERTLYGGILFLSTMLLTLSMVRGAWITIWIGILVVVRVYFARERSDTLRKAPLRSQMVPLLLIGGAIFCAATVWPVCLPESPSVAERVTSTFDPGSDSLQLRWAFWEGTGRMIRDHFWTGVGVGNFALAFVPYRTPFIYRNPGVQVEHPHNEYLDVWAELGPLGLLACLWLVLRVIRLGRHLTRHAQVRREILAGVLGSLAAAAAYGTLFYIAHIPESAVNLAILLGLLDGMDREVGQVERARPLRLTPLLAGSLVMGLLSFQFFLRPLVGEVQYFIAQNELRDHRMEASLGRLERSLAWNPQYYMARYLRAQIFTRMGKYAETIHEAQEMLRVHPKSEIAYWVIGTTYLKLGERSKAKAMFLQALDVNPDFPHALNNLGIIAAQEGRIAEAEVLFLRAKAILGRRDVRPYINLGTIYEATGHVKEALEMYEVAASIQPNSGSAWYSVARLRVLAGDRNGAHAALARAIELDETLRARAATDAAFETMRQSDSRVQVLLQESTDNR